MGLVLFWDMLFSLNLVDLLILMRTSNDKYFNSINKNKKMFSYLILKLCLILGFGLAEE